MNFTNLINQYRSDLGLPNLIIVVVLLNNNFGGAYQETVRAAQVSVAAALSNIITIDPDAFALDPLDNTHYTAQGNEDLGNAIFNVLKDL